MPTKRAPTAAPPPGPQIPAKLAAAAAAIGAIIVLIVGIPLALALNIWIDEAFTLHSTAHGVVYAWHEATRFEIQPPLYFVLEAAWRLMDESSIGFARLPSVFFVAAAVAVMVFSARRIAPRIPPVAVAVCTAVNAIAVWASVEMRVYPLVFLEAAILSWAFVEGFVARLPSRGAQIVYASGALLGLYTQYFIGFLLLGHGVALLIARKELRAYVLSMIPVTLAFMPFLPTVRFHLSANRDLVERMSVVHVFHAFADTIFTYVLPHETDWTGWVKLAGFCSAGLLLITLAVFGRPRLGFAARMTAGAWLTSAVTFAAALAVTGGDAYFRRHLIVLAPPAILLGYAWLSAASRRQRLLDVLAAMTFAVFTGATLASDYHPPLAKLGDWQRVARLVGNTGKTPVAVFPAELALPLGVYRLSGVTVPLPVPMPYDPSYVDVRPLHDEAQVGRGFAALPPTANRFWMVTQGPCAAAAVDFNFNCRYLERYLARHDRLLEEHTYPGAQARLYERASGSIRAVRRASARMER